MIVSGATGTGKTHFVLKLIDNINTLIKPTPKRIIYYFMEDQPIFRDYPEVDFRHGTPSQSDFDSLHDTIVIFDDQMMEADLKMLHVFTRASHHRQNSVVFIVQNFFNTNKHMRTISLNGQYLVFFKSPRDNSQFGYLARQVFPGKSQHAIEAYKNATQEPFSYLLLDLRCEQHEELRLRTNVFPGETQVVYVPK